MIIGINWDTVNWEVANTISSSILAATAIFISVVAIIKTSRDNNRILEENSRAYISIYTEVLIS